MSDETDNSGFDYNERVVIGLEAILKKYVYAP
jgi:hypothetical protein